MEAGAYKYCLQSPGHLPAQPAREAGGLTVHPHLSFCSSRSNPIVLSPALHRLSARTSVHSILSHFQGTTQILVEPPSFSPSEDPPQAHSQPTPSPNYQLLSPRNTFYPEHQAVPSIRIPEFPVRQHNHHTLLRTRKSNRNQGTKQT